MSQESDKNALIALYSDAIACFKNSPKAMKSRMRDIYASLTIQEQKNSVPYRILRMLAEDGLSNVDKFTIGYLMSTEEDPFSYDDVVRSLADNVVGYDIRRENEEETVWSLEVLEQMGIIKNFGLDMKKVNHEKLMFYFDGYMSYGNFYEDAVMFRDYLYSEKIFRLIRDGKDSQVQTGVDIGPADEGGLK